VVVDLVVSAATVPAHSAAQAVVGRVKKAAKRSPAVKKAKAAGCAEGREKVSPEEDQIISRSQGRRKEEVGKKAAKHCKKRKTSR
jgi:hypothetical protein